MTTQVPRMDVRRGRARHAARRTGVLGAVRPVMLFGRARNVPAFACGLVVVALLAWWAGNWLMEHPRFDGPMARPPVTALAPLLVAVLLSATLYAADEELERSGAWGWSKVRMAQVVLLTAAGGAAVAVTVLDRPDVYGALEMVRNTLGCVGLAALATTVLGGRLGWAPVFGYVVAVYFVAPKPLDPDTGWWTWPVQSSESASAWWACGAWFVLGALAYAWKGSRARRWDDA